MRSLKTSERIIPDEINTKTEYVLFILHLFSYSHVLSLVEKDSTIIDLGCGDGYGTSILSEKALKVVGIDVDDSIIARANYKYGENAEFLVYDGVKIPYGDASVDIVVSFQVIEHVDDVENYLSEVDRVLKNDGYFFVSTPNRVHRLKPNQKPWNIYHKREYDAESFDRILKTVFHNVQVQGIRGSREIEEIELKRVKRNKYLASLDFVNLRTILPNRWKIRLASFVSNLSRSKENVTNEFKKKYSVDDIYLLNLDIDVSLQLFATCIKSQ